MRIPALLVLLIIFTTGCSSFKSSFDPGKKYSSEQLEKDYSIFQNILQESHPGLYWYTPKDSMDYYFNWGKEQIKDSLTEPEFKQVLSYVLAKMDCGHTTVRSSKNYSNYLDTLRNEKFFPLSLKLWGDTTVVAANLNRREHYLDSRRKRHSVSIPVYDPVKDSFNRTAIRRFVRPTKKERKQMNLQNMRSLRIDANNQTAFLDVNSFGRGYQLKKFFKQSFRSIRKHHLAYLVVDVRGNGGGSVTNSTLLSKYLADQKFKVCDSLYAISRKSHYKSYIEKYFLNRLFMISFTRKKKDGRFHFGYFERHRFKPKQKNHFNSKSYILIGGNSFSATTLFTNSVIKQDNVTVVGEETGGGSYGNTAWLIPDVKLPETKLEFRLPLFRLVMDKDEPKTGHGIFPEVRVLPTSDAIRRNADYKMDKVRQLINEDKSELKTKSP